MSIPFSEFVNKHRRSQLKELFRRGKITEEESKIAPIIHKVEFWTNSVDLDICREEEIAIGKNKVVSKVFPPKGGFGSVKSDPNHEREIACLKILNKYMTEHPCTCGPHFPKLISCKKNIEGSSSHRAICMSNQGINLEDLRKETDYKITIKNLKQQLECICKTLIECQLWVGWHRAESNVCVAEDGVISIIDVAHMVQKRRVGEVLEQLDPASSWTPSEHNVCIDKHGVISVIDFGHHTNKMISKNEIKITMERIAGYLQSNENITIE